MVTTMVNESRDDESGQYARSYSDEMVLEAVEQHGPAVGTSEIAAAIDSTRDTAYRRLRELENSGVVTSRKVGMARLWTLEEDDEADSDLKK